MAGGALRPRGAQAVRRFTLGSLTNGTNIAGRSLSQSFHRSDDGLVHGHGSEGHRLAVHPFSFVLVVRVQEIRTDGV
jgi:hypothetical protein